ncbi:uncharacterized protein C8Q71DRAFT_744148, partial [Rhodofomes roseus]
MTWVLGWPLYRKDSLEIAKKHNLVKDPKAGDDRRIQTARMWIADQVGIINAYSCWVDDKPEFVYAAYVEFGDKREPPAKVPRANMITDKQYTRLKRAMPLKNFGWYQHNDPSCELYRSPVPEYDNDEDDSDENSNGSGGESSDEDSDGDNDESSNAGPDDEERMDTAKKSAGDDSDNETVTDGVVSAVDSGV